MNGQLLIDINELSRRIGIPKGTLYQWVYLRRMPRLCAAKPFSNGFWFWSGRNGRSHRHGLSTSHLDEDREKVAD
jgi:hypothetical protein